MGLRLVQKLIPGKCRVSRCKHPDAGWGFCVERGHHEIAVTEGLIPADAATGIEASESADTVYSAGMAAANKHLEQEDKASGLEGLVQKFSPEIDEFTEYLPQYQIQTQEDMDYLVGTVLSRVKEIRSELKARRDEVVKPLKEGIDRFEAPFKAPFKALNTIEFVAKEKIAIFDLAQKASVDVALKTIEAGQGEAPGEIIRAAHNKGVEIPSNVSIRYEWKARVLDPEQVPREYCSPDQKKLNAQAKASEGKNPPQGVEYYKDPVTFFRLK